MKKSIPLNKLQKSLLKSAENRRGISVIDNLFFRGKYYLSGPGDYQSYILLAGEIKKGCSSETAFFIRKFSIIGWELKVYSN